jgi:hypothetical protein
LEFMPAVAVSGGVNPCVNLMSPSAVVGESRQIGARF